MIGLAHRGHWADAGCREAGRASHGLRGGAETPRQWMIADGYGFGARIGCEPCISRAIAGTAWANCSRSTAVNTGGSRIEPRPARFWCSWTTLPIASGAAFRRMGDYPDYFPGYAILSRHVWQNADLLLRHAFNILSSASGSSQRGLHAIQAGPYGT
jgi:hypothetical protein